MLDPRIYRTGLILAALALVVLGFSLRSSGPPLNPTIAPEAFNAPAVYATMQSLALQDPDPAPGSASDDAIATRVSQTLQQYGFSPSTTAFRGRTIAGTVPLENVVGLRQGMRSGSIVIVAGRDMPGLAGQSATATLLELARDLQGETLNRNVVLASTSGSQGTAGAIHLAQTLPGPIDGVLVLGDLAGARAVQPVVDPWSTGRLVAPPRLAATLAAALANQQAPPAPTPSLGVQLAHLALPYTLGQQAPFDAAGIPAVTLSVSGEHPPAPDAPVDVATLGATGRAVLQTISALDGGPTLPAPAPYLLLSGKVVPNWAVSLFVLALMAPVALTAVDGLARARRRGHVIWRSLVVVLAAAAPFLVAVIVVLVARLVGLIAVAPPGPVAPGAVPLHGAGIAVLAAAVLAAAAAAAGVVVAWRRIPAQAVRARSRAARHHGSWDGTFAALLVAMFCVTLAVWARSPFTALLVVPALHLWMWAASPDLPLPRPVKAALVALGLAPAVLVVVYYANALGYSLPQLVWAAALLLAGHGIGLGMVLVWCIALGCLASAAALALMPRQGSDPQPAPAVNIRGPASYAGPGSLGGTESALRR